MSTVQSSNGLAASLPPDESLINRAMAAYFRYPVPPDAILVQPSSLAVQEVDGLTYVMLGNISGILAVYRVTNRGDLKRLKRWPTSIEF